MTARTTLLRGRAFAQSLMVDACVIEHPVPPITTNPVTGQAVTTYVPVYAGPCKVGPSSPSASEVGEAHLATLAPTIHVPATVLGVVEEDRVTITASVYDPDLVGKHWRVQGPMQKTWGTARRLQVIEVTS